MTRRLNERQSLYIFHISRAKARPEFLHSLPADRDFISQVQGFSLCGRYGKEPRIESVTLLRGDLYRLADEAVKQWVFEQRFIPRFLICAGVFLVAYFFASFVIRDPLPVIDELLIAGAASVITWLLIGKRFLASRSAEEKRGELYTIIDAIAFTESDFVKKVEDYLAQFDGADPARLLSIYNSAGNAENAGEPFARLALLPEWEAEAEALDACLETVFQEKRVRNFGRRLGKYAGAELEKTFEALRRLVAGTRIDFPLFVLYTVLHRSLE
ncbi:MAG: hypothetical protein LBQ57_00730 [Spirochaetales bacterium]|jgi:hypothetical protein|nr:hypothetical protein [Spirochaetales bacterium]